MVKLSARWWEERTPYLLEAWHIDRAVDVRSDSSIYQGLSYTSSPALPLVDIYKRFVKCRQLVDLRDANSPAFSTLVLQKHTETKNRACSK